MYERCVQLDICKLKYKVKNRTINLLQIFMVMIGLVKSDLSFQGSHDKFITRNNLYKYR